MWKRSLTVLFTATCALTLTGCGALMQRSSAARAPLDASLTAECPVLSPLAEGTGAAVLRKMIEVSDAYYDCAARHRALVNAVRP